MEVMSKTFGPDIDIDGIHYESNKKSIYSDEELYEFKDKMKNLIKQL